MDERDPQRTGSTNQMAPKVQPVLKDMERGMAQRVVLNFYAPSGFGKSDSLIALWGLYEADHPASLVRVRRNGDIETLQAILNQIIGDLELRLPERTLQALGSSEILADSAQMAARIKELVEVAHESGRPVMLLFDDYDCLAEPDRRDLEQLLLDDLAATRQVILVFTSKYELKFTESFELRTRRQRFPISSMSLEDIGVEYPDYVDLANLIHNLTGGMQALVESLVSNLRQKHPDVTDMASFQNNQEAILADFYQKRNIRFFEDTDDETRTTILTLALLRRFDIKVLDGILPITQPREYHNYGPYDYLDLLHQLGTWLRWRDDGGYALHQAHETVLRAMIAWEEPDMEETVHAAAAAYYRRVLCNDFRVQYAVELIYHRLRQEQIKHGTTDLGQRDLQKVPIAALLEGTNGGAFEHIEEDRATALQQALVDDSDLKGLYEAKELNNLVVALIKRLEKEPDWLADFERMSRQASPSID